MEPYDVKQMGILSPDYVHTLALATRQALTDDDHWVSDPDFDYVPVKALLSDEWIDSARTHLVADTVPARMTALDSMLAFKDGNTTHLVVVDSSGDIVSLTQSINYFFGSGVMVPEYGLLLNNHMADFTADSTGAGALAPFHRPRSNMAPTIVRKDGRPVLIIGTPGGARIPATLAQILIDIIDFDMPLNEALNAPRFFPVRHILAIENRIPDSTQVAMRARGWRVEPLGSISTYFGGVQAIQIDTTSGALIGASDPRRDGAPAGY
jgi:gamma-glutamyltranspeptidase/glutathione hydrolase